MLSLYRHRQFGEICAFVNQFKKVIQEPVQWSVLLLAKYLYLITQYHQPNFFSEALLAKGIVD
jgi:hypothetical protein